MEPYVLLPMARRSGVVEGPPFHTVRRIRWEFTIRIFSLESGGSVDVILEGGPDAADDDAFETLLDLGTLSSTGTTMVYSYDPPGSGSADFTMTQETLWLRAQIDAAVGEHVVEVLAASRFLDLTQDEHDQLLPSALRASIESKGPLVDRAERDVIRWLQQGIQNSQGSMAIKTDDVVADELIREAIVQQAAWLARRQSLVDSSDQVDRSEGRAMGMINPEIRDILHPILRYDLRTWRGR